MLSGPGGWAGRVQGSPMKDTSSGASVTKEETEAPRGGHQLIHDAARTKPGLGAWGSALHCSPKGWKPAWGPWLHPPAPGHPPKGFTLPPRAGPGLDKQPWKDARKRGWGHRTPLFCYLVSFPGLPLLQACGRLRDTSRQHPRKWKGLRPHHLGLHIKQILHIFKSPCLR